MLPVATLPKLTLDGVAAICAWIAVPPKVTVSDGFEALLVMAMLPVELPAVVGANVTAKEVFAPAFKVTGKPRPLMLNPVPDTVA